VAEIVADKDIQGDKPPQPVQLASRGVTATVACLAALVVIAAATANFLPSLDGFALPKFDRFSQKFDHLSFPDFNRAAPPKSDRVVAQLPQKTASVPIPERKPVLVSDPKPAPAPVPDPLVTAALKDIQSSQKDLQSSQQQNAVVLASLTQSSATQQTDLKRISRQLTALAVQVDALNAAAAPPTTGSIPHPHANPGIARVNPRARVLRTARRTEKPEPPLPPPVGPVSVGGAPLAPALATASVVR
jgi:hypothetical protein